MAKQKHKSLKAGPELAALVLAAGQGKRMQSQTPKILHKIAGKEILTCVLEAVHKLPLKGCGVVLSSKSELFAPVLRKFPNVTSVLQPEPRGTGDAVASAAPLFPGLPPPKFSRGKILSGAPFTDLPPHVLICTGDTPALCPELLGEFVEQWFASKLPLAVLGMDVPNPQGYGRLIVKKNRQLERIVEDRDTTAPQRKITLCNSGIIGAETRTLFDLLGRLETKNEQGEYYLTDIFSLGAKHKKGTFVFATSRWESFLGINDRQQLAALEQLMVQEKIRQLMLAGTTFHLPATSFVELDVRVEPDTEIGVGAIIKGDSWIQRGAVIGDYAILENATVGPGTTVPARATVNGRKP